MGKETVRQPKVLIVDDLSFMRVILREIVIKNGFGIADEAENGEVAIEKYRMFHPDLVILDITMPVMDGLKLVSLVRKDEIHKDIPIVIITTEGAAEVPGGMVPSLSMSM